MTLTTKLGASLLATSSIAGLGYAGSKYFEKDTKKVNTVQQVTTINDLITERYDYILLNTSDDGGDQDKWSEKWESYKRAKDNVFNLNGWDANNARLDLTNPLKKKCEDLAKEDSAKVSYENVTKYCARGVTLEEQAKKDTSEVLNTSNSDHASVWTKRHGEKGQIDAELKKLGMTGDLANGDAIKSGCNNAKSWNKQVNDYPNVYKAYKRVCTRQTNDPK
ncbi:hypothetical protein A6V39_01335 [Candidatus Mycoplasma haematobovis]|uniref:Uncharacterized protein n=1 Tax=Candidatus Mycoplasma haematobovis TaxID=432608 RepID=A0A1A9QE00_9MOLU|nr:hypothetical protein [Candidatus Mycoplasma haematobovis]OAL10697.1 hypothetical protein A6V39_01335 [Candidatus Mycoplasma haematobovis]